MSEYRLYMLNPRGHIVDAKVLDCKDDGEAIRLASEVASFQDAELWRGERKVEYFRHPAHEA